MRECVVRMEMPESCDECPMEYDGFMCAAIHKRFYPKKDGRYLEPLIDPEKERLPDCPILAVLPEKHGKIGDIDSLAGKINAARIRTMQRGGDTNPYWECSDLCLQTPTIVPATEGGNHEAD